MNGTFKPEDKKKRTLVIPSDLEKIQSASEINENHNRILLNGNIFTHAEMLEIISNHSKKGRQFYIRPKQMDVVIGDEGVLG